MLLFTKILCVKCNVLYIGGHNVQVRGGPELPSAGPAYDSGFQPGVATPVGSLDIFLY